LIQTTIGRGRRKACSAEGQSVRKEKGQVPGIGEKSLKEKCGSANFNLRRISN